MREEIVKGTDIGAMRKTLILLGSEYMAYAVLLPGKSHGPRSLVGCHLWGHTELEMTEET